MQSFQLFAYLLPRKNKTFTAILASARDGKILYGAQFIANRASGFPSYYRATRNEHTREVKEALKQFEEKKTCRRDAMSPPGYVLPLGLLNQSDVSIRTGAF